MSKPRYFVCLGAGTAAGLLDRAEQHGKLVNAVIHAAPARTHVYGFAEIDPTVQTSRRRRIRPGTFQPGDKA